MTIQNKNMEAWLSSSFSVKEVPYDNEQGTKSIKIGGYANTVTEDRAGDVIPSTAWINPKAMTNYLKNPIVLFQHEHDEPIGKMLSHSVDDKGLYVEIEVFNVDKRVFTLIEQEVLKAFSVGFRITEYSYDVEEDIFTIEELELFEISVVSIPCNQDSTFSLKKSMDSLEYKNLKDSIREKHSAADAEQPQFNTELEKLAFALGY